MRNANLYLIAAVLMAMLPTALAQQPGINRGVDQLVDPLTGVWHANDGGTYQIRRDGNRVWWYGRGPKNGLDWQNVFSGTISGNQVTGEWADLPPGGLNIRAQ
jgi:hypothetical protein